jgi:hypothetical protein
MNNDLQLLHRVETIRDSEWDDFDLLSIEEVKRHTDKAVVLTVKKRGKVVEELFPISQLRKDDDGSIYASDWIMGQRGF